MDGFYGQEDPTLIDTNTIHMAFRTLDEFKRKNGGKLPHSWHLADSEEFIATSRILNSKQPEPFKHLNEHLLKLFACTCRGNLPPLQSVIGGMAAQEVIKACTGKFHPIFQFFYFDCRDVLPDNPFELLDDLTRFNSQDRYSGQVSVFGSDFQRKLKNLRCFLVGTGALGCEYIKNFAMMGVSCGGGGGQLTITDMDTIEKSNLNRQFLFRSWDVNKFKAEVACASGKAMNPHMNIQVNLNRVGVENESIYNEDFYKSVDVVCNALDNVKTRLYIDAKIIEYQKPLIESGTLGTQGNVQVVVPFLTQTYSSDQDPPEKSIAICTLKIFPNLIEHTIQWARDKFQGFFTNPAVAALSYMKNPASYLQGLQKLKSQQALEELRGLEQVLVTETCQTFEQCVQWAKNSWEENFHDSIGQLLASFPPDHLTSAGLPFWSGPKRCPHVLNFDASEKLHFEYVFTAANLKASMHCLDQERDRGKVLALIKARTERPDEARSKKRQIKINETNKNDDDDLVVDDGEEEDLARLTQFFEQFHTQPEKVRSRVQLRPVEFEKDDDTNLHMDFITTCSNLRAENYDIPPTDKYKVCIGNSVLDIQAEISLSEHYRIFSGFCY
jgi:ubiquitin-activating enzyme E1